MSVGLYLFIGVAIGLALGWFARAARHPQQNGAIEAELREQLRLREQELKNDRQSLNEISAARAGAEVAKDSAERSLAEARVLHEQVRAHLENESRESREKLGQIGGALATAQAQLDSERKAVQALNGVATEQRQVHEQSVANASEALRKVVLETDDLRKRESELERKLATATAELASERKTNQDLQLGATELREQHKQAADKAVRDLEQAGSQLHLVRENLGQANSDLATANAQLRAERTSLSELRAEHQSLIAAKNQLHEESLTLRTNNGALDSQVKLLNERLTAERQQIETIQEKFHKEFEAISNKLLVDSSSRFSQQSSESLEKLLTPLRENLTVFKASLDGTRQESATHSALLKEQIARIGTEASNLVKALKGDVKVLGNWGENMLDQILEKSGLILDTNYHRQHSGKDSEGDARILDVVIDLPNNRQLVIDSKASLRFYEESVNSPDEETRLAALDRHVDSIRKHIRDLGQKRYHELYGINAPDFVLMYLPVEAAYFSAISREPSLFAEALDRNVVLITNSTLLGTLRTVNHVWQLAAQQKNAMDIAQRGGLLYDKFVGFIEDLKQVGSAINNSQRAWETATNKLHTGPGNLVRQAEQLRGLGAKASKALPTQIVEKSVEVELPTLPASPESVSSPSASEA